MMFISCWTFVAVRILEASYNKLAEIPTEVGDMKSLEQLYLQHNLLSSLPLLPGCSSLKVHGRAGR